MGRTLAVIIPLLAVCVCARADLKEVLSESIIGPKQGMMDVQDYCEARIPAMPKVETKEEREVIEKDWTMDKTPEMFCFGLLAEFDLKEIEGMVGAGKVKRN